MKKNTKSTLTKEAEKEIKTDTQFQLNKLSGVESNEKNQYTLNIDGGYFCVSSPDFVPKKGMSIKTYGKGIGYPIRGVIIDDVVIYYLTEKEAEADFNRHLKTEKAKRVKAYNKNIKKIQADYDALPEIFRKRIDKFRKVNPDFKYEYESYEMFCCSEAVKIATTLKTVEAISDWAKLPYEEQKKMVDVDDGHSGNTFGCACGLAKLYIKSPEYVLLAHGALTPLVGCKAYGCEHEGQ
jgi:hypothetical protein